MSRATILLLIVSTMSYPTANSAEPDIVQQVAFGRQVTKNVIVDSLPEIYMPYTPGQRIPRGWRCITINIPVTETCTKTVCEETVVQVPKQVPCMVNKEIRVPTEVYKTYVRFKEIRVEDAVLESGDATPAAELEELEREMKSTTDKQASRLGGNDNRMITVSTTTRQRSDAQGLENGTEDAYERVPVTKVRTKTVKIHVPVTRTVEVDEGCWKEITVVPPCPCGVPSCASQGGCRLLGGAKAKPKATVRCVWEPRIVKREVTVLEMRETTIDEPYTEYVQRPKPGVAPEVAPDDAPEVAPDDAPEVAPDELVTEDRTVLVPQYITKAERHYLTRTIRTPSTKTIYVPVKQVVRREVPYEVRRIETQRVLVPMTPGVVPSTQQPQTPNAVMPLSAPATNNESAT